jgi:hypothetical protein
VLLSNTRFFAFHWKDRLALPRETWHMIELKSGMDVAYVSAMLAAQYVDHARIG